MISLRELLFEEQFPETKGLYAGPYGKYYSSPDFNPSSYMGKISNGKWVPKAATTSTKKAKITAASGTKKAKITPQVKPVQPTSKNIKQPTPVQATPRPTFKSNIIENSTNKIEQLFSSGKFNDFNSLAKTVAGLYNRTGKMPSYRPGGKMLQKLNEEYMKNRGVEYGAAIYNNEDDSVETDVEYVGSLPSTPVQDWKYQEIYAISTHAHEILHSTSQRIREPSQSWWYATAIGISVEEGLTEYLAQAFTNKVLSTYESPEEVPTDAYTVDVRMIDSLVAADVLDVDAAFTQSANDLWNTIYYAQENYIKKELSNLVPNDMVESTLNIMDNFWQDSVLICTHKQFMDIIQKSKTQSPEEANTAIRDFVTFFTS
jgi:hypothetical protein